MLGHAMGQDVQRLHTCVLKPGGELAGRALAPPPCAMCRQLMALPDASELCANSSIAASSPCCLFCNHSRACREVGGCGGAVGLGTGMGTGVGSPYQDQRPASLPGCGLSSVAAADPSAPRGPCPGDHAQGPCRGMVAAIFLQSQCRRHVFPLWTITILPKSSCPRAVTISGCQQPPWPVSGGPSPTQTPCFCPHPPGKQGQSPGSPGAGGTGTRRLWLTKQSSVVFLFSPISLQHPKAVESPDLRCDKHWGLC